MYIFIRFYDIPPNGKYYLFGGQYLPINEFEFTFNGVIQLHFVNRTWLSLCVIHSFTWTESLSEFNWGNRKPTPFEWSLRGIISSENLVIGIDFTRMESDLEYDWGNRTRTLFEWSLCEITSSENFNFFYIIPLIGIIWSH